MDAVGKSMYPSQACAKARATNKIDSHMKSRLATRIYICVLRCRASFMTCAAQWVVHIGHITYEPQVTIHIPAHHGLTALSFAHAHI